MKKRIWAFAIPAVILLAVFLVPSLLTSRSAVMDKPSKEDVAHKMQSIQMPFVANNGQVDKQVKFYAKTFGGTVFVTKDGEIVYSLPNNSSDVETQCLASPMHSPSGISPLKRGDQGVCKTATTLNDMKETHPRPLLLEGRPGISLREEFVGAKVNEIQGEDASVTKVNYFKGNDPSQWKTNISTYDVVSLGEVYDGIELKLKAYGNNVEKLFCVKSGANPDQIKISLSGLQPSRNPPPLSPSVRGTGSCPPLAGAGGGLGARGLWVNEHGELVAETELGAVKFTKPVAYQEINGKRVDVEVEYVIRDREPSSVQQTDTDNGHDSRSYCFTVASYDKSQDLIIDPLLASTFLGGSNDDYGDSIAIDTSGNVYVTGYTYSTDFPTTSGAYDTSQNGATDVFVSKLDSGLTSLLASTFLGGSGLDYGVSLAIDTSGNVYVTGYTYYSSDFPTTSGAYDTSFNSGYYDAFVLKLDSGLISLLASTYLGGSGGDYAWSLALDTGGNVYVTGETSSTDFPTTSGAYDTSYNGNYDVFISKLDSGLTSLLASTYLGGSGQDFGQSLTLDTSGNVYVAGSAFSSNFPTTIGAYDTTFNGGDYDVDVFVSKLDGGLTSLLASTYLGGSGYDEGYYLALDTSGNVYATGRTYSSDFPTTSGAYDTSRNVNWDVFVSKLDGGLTSLLASTYLGGSGYDGSEDGIHGYSLVLDTGGNVYVAGYTESTDFPTTSGAYDTSYNSGSSSGGDVFVSKLNGGLTSLLASTFLGGSNGDSGNSIAIDKSGNVYVTGYTYSTDFPTTSGAYDTSFNGGTYDVFISKLDSNLSASTGEPTPTPKPSPTTSPAPTLPPLPTPKVSPSPVQEGIVFGIVNDEDDNPLKDVTVTITGNNVSNNTTTDDDGYYEFTGLAAGSYTLTYEKEGYKAQSQDISLEAGETKELEVVTMEEVVMGTIYGYVVNIQGNPIEDARVRLKGVRTKVSKSTASDADGFFEFTDLGADTYLLFTKKTRFKKAKVTVRLKEGEDKEVEIEMKRTTKRLKG